MRAHPITYRGSKSNQRGHTHGSGTRSMKRRGERGGEAHHHENPSKAWCTARDAPNPQSPPKSEPKSNGDGSRCGSEGGKSRGQDEETYRRRCREGRRRRQGGGGGAG